jgi:hypothetical protein
MRRRPEVRSVCIGSRSYPTRGHRSRFPSMRRLLRVLIVIGVLVAVIMAWTRRARPSAHIALPDIALPDTGLPDTGLPNTRLPNTAPTSAPRVPVATWVEPIDGACPDGFPVKAKLSSGIFHVPGMVNYARTTPDRCYASPEAAAADGLRPAKR